MAGTSPKFAFPYPSGSDPISSGDDVIRSLTTTLDTVLAVGPIFAGVLNGAWIGILQSRIVGGLVMIEVSVTTGTALINTWYDIGTLHASARPVVASALNPAYVSGYAGIIEVQTGGLVRANMGAHPSGGTDVRATVFLPKVV